jgi:ABC-type lipoprotein release transport system permease subunit
MVSLSASGSATLSKKGTEKLTFSSPPDGVAVVSSGLLNLLGISEKKAVGTSFKSSFIVGKSLLPSIEGKVQSQDQTYKIIGVIEDPNSTYFYIPYGDVVKLGIPHVSQFKVILKETESLAKVRKEIETLGFRTNSTYDTVKQIESLFVNLRFVLAILGLVALGVASLGMFNTLTVSLLERTREIGGMKTMGMVSEEVQDLFLAEAMIMGLSGGIGGLTLGYLAGKGLSFIISAIALSQGQGFLDLTYIPLNFTIFILITSFIVGVATGIYPAQRAKHISALNALRYE